VIAACPFLFPSLTASPTPEVRSLAMPPILADSLLALLLILFSLLIYFVSPPTFFAFFCSPSLNPPFHCPPSISQFIWGVAKVPFNTALFFTFNPIYTVPCNNHFRPCPPLAEFVPFRLLYHFNHTFEFIFPPLSPRPAHFFSMVFPRRPLSVSSSPLFHSFPLSEL